MTWGCVAAIRVPRKGWLAIILGLAVVSVPGAYSCAQVLPASQHVPWGESLIIRGRVKSGNTPIPGATVSAVNSATGKKFATWTDVDGSYALAVPEAGEYVLRAEMTAFAPASREVAISGSGIQADLSIVLESPNQRAGAYPRRPGGQVGAGLQGAAALATDLGNDAVAGNAGDQVVPAGMPVPGIAPEAATESVAVTGSATGSGMAGMSSDEMQQRIREAREQQGGFGGGFGGGPGGGPGGKGPGAAVMIFGGRRGRFDINRPHGMLFYTVGDSALDAAPYSLTGQPVAKPEYLQQRFGGSLGGPLNIPKLYHGGNKTFFFINYTGIRGDNPYDAFSTVPTADERHGDFSQSTALTHDNNGKPLRVPVQLFYPNVSQCPEAGQPIPGNNLKNADPRCPQISSIAQGLLPFLPMPNLPGASPDTQNFHFITSVNDGSDDLNFRLNHSFGAASNRPRRAGFGGKGMWRGNNLNVGIHYHRSNSTLTNPFPKVSGNTNVRSFDVPVAYIRSFGKLTNIARVDFNRNRISTLNLYAFAQNITGDLGIGGVSNNPFDWGLPNLSFTGFGGLRDTNPLLRRDQTWTFADIMVWNRGKHTWRWGGDFRRIQLNTETDSNARGSFIFTGFNTAQEIGGSPVPGTGFDFADFLLGFPQQTSVQFGENNYHFRGNSWDLFVQDEWKVRGTLTLNLGLRYEYVSPLSEINDRIVNLFVAPEFLANPGFNNPSAVRPVLPGQVGFPSSLVRPDRNNFAPRIGVAWKALPNTVVRAGYGINYNTSAYSTIVQQLAFQPPFAITQTNIESAAAPLTLQAGFPPAPGGSITNNYGVDPNYRLGYVQIWNVDVQQELNPTLLLNLDYTGTKGSRLDIVEAPNRTANGVRLPDVQPFQWETSGADSAAHAGTVRLRKRLQNGVSIGGSYTFSKAMDDASTIGGGTTVVAQNAFDLAAERGLSSFDQRHKFSADYLWQLPFGHDRRWLRQPGVFRALAGDWQWSGNWSIASGVPFSPSILGNFSEVRRGTNGTLRPDVTGNPVALSDPTVGEWFNTAAFVAPPPGQFGNARRNSIEGPGVRIFNMAFSKLVPMAESRTLELRAQFSNVFNTPQFSRIDTVVNSPTFGHVVAVGAMRAVQFSARFRF